MHHRVFAVIALSLSIGPALAAAPGPPVPTQPLYVADYGDNSIAKIGTNGSVISSLSTVSQPFGLAFDTSGSLYVTSAIGDTITKYAYDSATGMPSSTGSTFGDGSDGLDYPNALTFDSSGHLFAASFNTNTVVEFDGAHHRINTLSGSGPTGLAFDKSGNLFVANQTGGSITKYTNNNGVFTGSLFASVTFPDGMAFDKDGNLFVTGYNNKLTMFANSGGTLSQTGTQFSDSTGLNKPYGLAFDSAGDLFVANYGATAGSAGPGTTIIGYTYNTSTNSLNATGATFASGLNRPGFLAFAPAPNVAGAPEPSEWAALGFTAFSIGVLLLRARRRLSAGAKRKAAA